MKLKEFNIKLDIMRNRIIDGIEVVQGDYGTNIFNIDVFADSQPYDFTGLTAEIAFAKPDGTTVVQDNTTMEGNRITCILNTNTTSVAGLVHAQVRILEGTKVLTTADFNFTVRRSIVNDDTVKSTNEFPILQKLKTQLETLKSEITDSKVSADTATTKANTAAGNADTKAALASEKAALANAAITNINNTNTAMNEAENARQTDYTQKINDFVAETERVEALYPERLTKVEDEYMQHLNSTMPHIFYDLKNNKKYRYGRRLSENGVPQIISEEVIE